MANNNPFVIDTKGFCLLCRRDDANESGTLSDASLAAFKMLLRYLKIDIMKLGIPFATDPDSVNLSVSLCESCSSLTTHFFQLFQDFEKIRTEMDWCVQKLHSAIKEGDEDDRVRKYRNRLTSTSSNLTRAVDILNINVAERLRKETLEKCGHNLTLSKPKIIVDKTDQSLSAKIRDVPPPEPVTPIPVDNVQSGESSKKCEPAILMTGDEVKMKKGIGDRLQELQYDMDTNDDGHLEAGTTTEKSPSSPKISARPGVTSSSKQTIIKIIIKDKDEVVPAKVRKLSSASACYFDEINNKAQSEQKESRKQNAQNESSMLPFVKCPHCNKSFEKEGQLKTHLKVIHTFIHFSDKLPRGTTDEELQSVVWTLLAKAKDPKNDKSKVCTCPLCHIRLCDGFQLRAHVLRAHFPFILDALKNPNEMLKLPLPKPNFANREKSVPAPATTGGKHSSVNSTNSSLQQNDPVKNKGSHQAPKDQVPSDETNQKVPLSLQGCFIKIGTNKYKCLKCECDTICVNIPEFHRHFQEKHTNATAALTTTPTTLIKCKYCPVTFLNQANLDSHLVRSHTLLKYANKFPPKTTEEELQSVLQSLFEQRKIIPQPGNPRILNGVSSVGCPICGKVYRRESVLKMHFLLEHLTRIALDLRKMKERDAEEAQINKEAA